MDDSTSPPPSNKKCCSCQRELELGVDVLCVESGVIGPRGIVPLADLLFFCGDSCVASYFGNEEAVQLNRRVP